MTERVVNLNNKRYSLVFPAKPGIYGKIIKPKERKSMDNNFQPIFDYIDKSNKELEAKLDDKLLQVVKPIFAYIDESNKQLKQDLKEELVTKDDFREVKTSIANLSSQVKQYHEEMMVSGHRLERLEKWAEMVGDKVGIPIVF